MTLIDVTDSPYGAAGDGETDDREAIQNALDDAQSGDTVFLPEPDAYYSVGNNDNFNNASLVLTNSRISSPITIQGENENTIIRLSGDISENSAVLKIEEPDGLSVDVRNLVLDGAKDDHSQFTRCIHARDTNASGPADVLFENVVLQNASGPGTRALFGGLTYRYCTARYNGRHGFVSNTTVSGVHDPPVLFERCYAHNNAAIDSGFYGFDLSGGRGIARDCVTSDNEGSRGGGMKTASENIEARFIRVRTENNSGVAFRPTNTPSGSTVVFEDIVAENNEDFFRFGASGDYDVSGEIVVTNSRADNAVYVDADGTIDASDADIYVNGSEDDGMWVANATGDSVFDNFFYSDNAGDDIGQQGDLRINNVEQRDKTDIEAVPTADEVGAFTEPVEAVTEDDPDPVEEHDAPIFEDWSPQWMSEHDDWSVVSGGEFVGDHALKFERGDGDRDRYAISWDEVGEPSDVELLDRFRVPSFTDADNLGFHARTHLRSSGSAGSENGYWVEIENREESFRLAKYSDSGGSSLVTLGRFGTPSEGTFLYRRFRAEGDELKAKIWPVSESEPSGWDIEVTDDEHDAGWVGLGSFDAGTVETDVVSVATGGESVSIPASVGEPTVSWERPTDGETVSDTVTARIDADAPADADGETEVVYRPEGGSWAVADYNPDSGFYEDAWDATALDDGQYTLEARATDSTGTTAEATVEVTVEVTIDDGFDIATLGARDVSSSSATLVGELADLGGADHAECGFEWREVGDDAWTATGTRTVDTVGEFSRAVSGLDADTDYEFRAIASAPTELEAGVRSFSADAADDGDTGPTIEQFDVRDRSNPAWNRFDVDWTVGHPESGLNIVVTKLRHNGRTVAAESTTVTGDAASFTHVMRVRGPVDEVVLSVNDTENRVATDTRQL